MANAVDLLRVVVREGHCITAIRSLPLIIIDAIIKVGSSLVGLATRANGGAVASVPSCMHWWRRGHARWPTQRSGHPHAAIEKGQDPEGSTAPVLRVTVRGHQIPHPIRHDGVVSCSPDSTGGPILAAQSRSVDRERKR